MEAPEKSISSHEQAKGELRKALETAIVVLTVTEKHQQAANGILIALKNCRSVEQIEAICIFAEKISSLRHTLDDQEIAEKARTIRDQIALLDTVDFKKKE